MTDQPTTYSDQSGVTLTLDAARGWGEPEHLSVGITCECKTHTQIHDLVMFVPTARLLAMIDTEDPDALRDYLRERSDYLDSPEPTTTEHLKPLMEHFGIKTLDVPEADSPEDTDERPERDVFQWEEPPALTTAEHPATVYFDGLAVMLRARPMAWAKIAENVKTARYIKPMKDRGCEITTRNNDRSTRKGDVYARFVGQR